MTDAPTTGPAYPVQFSVDYPDRELDRLTTAFRIFTVIPIAIVLALVSAGGVGAPGGWDGEGRGFFLSSGAGGGGVILPPPVVIPLCPKDPRWWVGWKLNDRRLQKPGATY